VALLNKTNFMTPWGDYITKGVAIKYVIMLINTTVYGKCFASKHNNIN
jgi:hypothetical protein